MKCHTIMGILVDNRTSSAPTVQQILTKYGCNIKARLGLHETDENKCYDEGLIILQLCGCEEDIENLLKELNSLERVKAKKFVLSFDE